MEHMNNIRHLLHHLPSSEHTRHLLLQGRTSLSSGGQEQGFCQTLPVFLHLLIYLLRKSGWLILVSNLAGINRVCWTQSNPQFHKVPCVEGDQWGRERKRGACDHCVCDTHMWKCIVKSIIFYNECVHKSSWKKNPRFSWILPGQLGCYHLWCGVWSGFWGSVRDESMFSSLAFTTQAISNILRQLFSFSNV